VTPAVCVVLHDVADRTLPLSRRLLAEVHAVARVPVTLLAVPRYRGDAPSAELEAWLGERASRGDEIALHGFTHTDERAPTGPLDRLRRRVYTRGEGEFWDIGQADAAARLRAGAGWFAANGWPLRGFVAPAWLLGPQAWAALREARALRYTATLRYLHLLEDGRRMTAQSLVYSTDNAWRRAASKAWVALVARTQAKAPLLRLELHPGDVRDPAIRRQWQRLLAGALQAREAQTLGGFAAAFRRS
jgi:hypothetical protein